MCKKSCAYSGFDVMNVNLVITKWNSAQVAKFKTKGEMPKTCKGRKQGVITELRHKRVYMTASLYVCLIVFVNSSMVWCYVVLCVVAAFLTFHVFSYIPIIFPFIMKK